MDFTKIPSGKIKVLVPDSKGASETVANAMHSYFNRSFPFIVSSPILKTIEVQGIVLRYPIGHMEDMYFALNEWEQENLNEYVKHLKYASTKTVLLSDTVVILDAVNEGSDEFISRKKKFDFLTSVFEVATQDNKTIYVFDYKKKSFMKYDYSGQVLVEIDIEKDFDLSETEVLGIIGTKDVSYETKSIITEILGGVRDVNRESGNEQSNIW